MDMGGWVSIMANHIVADNPGWLDLWDQWHPAGEALDGDVEG